MAPYLSKQLDSKQFDYLLNLVSKHIEKEVTIFRENVSAKERLMATLRFLATGNSYQDLKYCSLISEPLLSKLISETCWAIYKCLKNYIQVPQSEEEWKAIAAQFESKWNFNNCIGACDGKHIAIQKPPRSGSLYYNYKGFFSVVLFAIVNANYEFIYVHTGTNGSVGDGSIWKSTGFYKKLENNELDLPPPSILPGADISVPYVFLGDSAFALKNNFMKPFPFKNITHDQRIFSYRLSRARRVDENTFAILSSRFRVFRSHIGVQVNNMDPIVLACCALHNFLRKQTLSYIIPRYIDRENTKNFTFHKGDWRNNTEGLSSLQRTSENQRNSEGSEVRNTFMNYFSSVGCVSFQEKMIEIVRM
ncbi:unnamed protein product [Parnassius mnemosyne]|uniref:DDE Tnp4 domain-containing protein n=1 Tax=Parnassius mnemosyne TaxID=213953 RepID=A0AAV1LTK5_9NEOP